MRPTSPSAASVGCASSGASGSGVPSTTVEKRYLVGPRGCGQLSFRHHGGVTLVQEPDSPVPGDDRAVNVDARGPAARRRRPDLGLLIASLVIACGGVLIVWGMTDALTGDDGVDRPAAIESVSSGRERRAGAAAGRCRRRLRVRLRGQAVHRRRRTADHAARPDRRRTRRDDRAAADRRVRSRQRGACRSSRSRVRSSSRSPRAATRPRSSSGTPPRARTPPAPTAGRSTSSDVTSAVPHRGRNGTSTAISAPSTCSAGELELDRRSRTVPGRTSSAGRASSSRPIRWYVSATSSAQ